MVHPFGSTRFILAIFGGITRKFVLNNSSVHKTYSALTSVRMLAMIKPCCPVQNHLLVNNYYSTVIYIA